MDRILLAVFTQYEVGSERSQVYLLCKDFPRPGFGQQAKVTR